MSIQKLKALNGTIKSLVEDVKTLLEKDGYTRIHTDYFSSVIQELEIDDLVFIPNIDPKNGVSSVIILAPDKLDEHDEWILAMIVDIQGRIQISKNKLIDRILG